MSQISYGRDMKIFLALLALFAFSGCSGGKSGGGSSSQPTPVVPLGYELKHGTVFLPSGIFSNGAEKDTDAKIWNGDRTGEVTFYSTAIGAEITGKHNQIVTVKGKVLTIWFAGGSFGLRSGHGDVDWKMFAVPTAGG